jgi:hypothetical protein
MKSKLPIAPTRELKELIEQIPSRLERLRQRALLLDGKPARQAASELLALALEVQNNLGPVFMNAPHLLRNEASQLFAFPVLVSLSRGHQYYYRRVLNQVKKLKLGSKTGIACHERANWKSDGEAGTSAVTLYNIVQALRTKSSAPDHLTKAYLLVIQKDHTGIAQNASALPPLSRSSVDCWVQTCLQILYIFRPSLTPRKQGRCRKGVCLSAMTRKAKDQRKAISARIRDMAARPDKSRSYKR